MIALLGLLCNPLTSAAADLTMGKLLVAAEEVHGSGFAQTVILLLHYDEHGAQGLVINRPMDVQPVDVFAENEILAEYSGTLYWGGPVQVSTMRALVRNDTAPVNGVAIFGDVYQVPLDESLSDYAMTGAELRFFVGYAGWAPGQLERELRFDSWHVLPASEEIVFADDPGAVWRRLSPPQEIRASVVWRRDRDTGNPAAMAQVAQRPSPSRQ